MAKKKDKKKRKNKDKSRKSSAIGSPTGGKDLKRKIKQLKKELDQRDSKIEGLNRQLQDRKPKKRKQDNGTSKNHFPQQLTRVAVAQKKAWKRHSYLRDRYEFHLGAGRDKPDARTLADKDLRAEFGEDIGYSEQELEQILT